MELFGQQEFKKYLVATPFLDTKAMETGSN
jgi:hypothetical protein